jgi:phosphatidylinositol N-acetylglucosaminyltransferase subunit C
MYDLSNRSDLSHDFSVHDDNQTNWQRALYIKQSFPDNHVDPKKFLDSLVISKAISPIPISSMVLGSTLIVQQLSVVAVFVGLYKYIISKVITFHGLLAFDIITLLLGNIINYLLSESQWSDIIVGLRYIVIMGVCLRMAAPILQTLTSSFSDDTIYALGIFFSMTHVIFRDYGNMTDSDNEAKVGTLSLSAAMLTAILLASRLQKIEVVFGFVLLAVICFSLFPITARAVYRRSACLHLSMLFCLWMLATTLLYCHQELFAFFVAYEILVVFVLIIGPIGLSSLSGKRVSMNGAWDIAKL